MEKDRLKNPDLATAQERMGDPKRLVQNKDKPMAMDVVVESESMYWKKVQRGNVPTAQLNPLVGNTYQDKHKALAEKTKGDWTPGIKGGSAGAAERHHQRKMAGEIPAEHAVRFKEDPQGLHQPVGGSAMIGRVRAKTVVHFPGKKIIIGIRSTNQMFVFLKDFGNQKK